MFPTTFRQLSIAQATGTVAVRFKVAPDRLKVRLQSRWNPVVETLKGRLESETPPGNFYELLDLAWFTNERELVLSAVRRATRFLHQYQNHKNPDIVQRARNLQLLCATAGHTFSDDQKWSAYDSALMTSLCDEFQASNSSVDPAIWLRERCQIVTHRIDEVVNFVRSSASRRSAPTKTGGDTHSELLRLPTFENPPFEIDHYQVLEQLGEGGIGVVFKARHRQLDKLFAIKLLRTDKSVDRNAASRFQREMKAIGKLDHPNIVRATDAGQYADARYLVMELIEGQNLQNVVASRGPLPVKEACQMIQQAALGLQHAFERGMVHRDIKPSNLMLSHDGTVKILDLGLALLLPDIAHTYQRMESTVDLTADGLIVGTIDFMAPEQRNGRQNVDARSDVYSLGCTMYYLLTGQVPFRECGDDVFVRLAAHATQSVAPLSRFRSDVPCEIEAIMRRMLAKSPAERFSSGGEVAVAISTALRSVSNDRAFRVALPPKDRGKSGPMAASATPDAAATKTKPPPLRTAVLQKPAPTPAVTTAGATKKPPLTGQTPLAVKTLPSVSKPDTDQSLPVLRPATNESNPSNSVLFWVTASIVAFTIIGVMCLMALMVRNYLHRHKPDTSNSVSLISTMDGHHNSCFERLDLPSIELHWDQTSGRDVRC